MKYRETNNMLYALMVTVVIVLVATGLCLSKSYEISEQQTDTLDQIMDMRHELDKLGEAEAVETATLDMLGTLEMVDTAEEIATEKALTSLGTFRITHYCPCERCCGKTDGITYTGTVATAGRTIGVDPDVIPLGSTVVIDGHEYVAEDIGGGIKGNEIDMFVEGHQEALKMGVCYEEVFAWK